MKDSTSPTGTFALTVEECRILAQRIVDHAEDHFGIDPDQVTWGHVADADSTLSHLKQAATSLGLREP